MRIIFSSGHAAMMADLEAAASELTKRQREVSSGKRMQAPSDDPSAWAAGVRERGEISAVDQYVRAADSATSRLTVADTEDGCVEGGKPLQRRVMLFLVQVERVPAGTELRPGRDGVADDREPSFRPGECEVPW